jgi:hypothetical protein
VPIVLVAVIALGVASHAEAQTSDIVLWTAQASAADARGDWTRVVDSSAAGGAAIQNSNRGRSRIVPAQASPSNYFEMRFTASRATAYRLWIRMRAQNDSTSNDSVHVQFSDAVDASGNPIMRIGTTASAEPVLQNGPGGAAPRGWGWTDNGWGELGTPIRFAADGTHVIRIQQREDGPTIDQIVLSPSRYLTSAPGGRRDDTTILPASGGVAPPPPSANTVVIRPATAAAGRMFGTWQTIADATAAGGQALRNPNGGASKITPALANPVSYFEATFTASAGQAYHLWLRMRADGNSTANDSVHVQFSDTVTSSGSPTARIGTTSSLEPVLQSGSSGPSPREWGWTDNGWGSLGSHIYFATSGTHTIRVQQREDGATIDQIAISPDTYLTAPPGWRRDDNTILPAGQTPPPTNQPPSVTLTAPASGATFTAPANITLSATASDPENRLARVEFYNGSTRLISDTSAPYSYTWSGVAAGSYQLRAVAVDADGATAASATATITVGTSTTTKRVAFTASADHATLVTSYLLEVFSSTANTATAVALASSNLGKPTPSSTNEIIVDRTTFLNGLAPGSYLITVAAVGSSGSSRSSAISFTR